MYSKEPRRARSAASEHPSGSPLPELALAITAAAVRLAAATAAWLRLIAEFDEREGWHGYGISSCAHWLAWQCGLSPGAAREHVRVARALRSLPRIEAAFAQGRLSYSKVRALTRITEPDTEAPLLELALELTASQLERTVRQWRRADAVDDGEPPQQGRELFDYWWDDAGMLTLRVRLATESGAALIAAIDSLAERAARRERAQATAVAQAAKESAGTAGAHPAAAEDAVALAREHSTARRIAALTSLAEVAADAGRRAGDPPRREVVVHVDAAVLADDAAAGRAYLEGGPAVSPAVARRMLCEATVVTMLEKGREPLAVGRRKRRATKAQRMALVRRDGGCARPGCPEARIERLHAHHMRHWLYGGRTDLTNLVLLCDRDHALVHDLDLVVSRRDGALVVTAPDGRRVWGAADAAFGVGLAALGSPAPNGDPFVGVHPIDDETARRPVDHSWRAAGPGSRSRRRGRRPGRRRAPGARIARHSRTGPRSPRDGAVRGVASRRGMTAAPPIGPLLFPDGEPPLPEAMHVNGERMNIGYVVGVLMGNRDLVRRLTAEAADGTP